jgi:hypothetical protein
MNPNYRFLEAILKIEFWFKFPSSPKGYAGQARRNRVFPAARNFPSDLILLRVKTVGLLAYFKDLKRGTNKMSLIRPPQADKPLAGWATRHF